MKKIHAVVGMSGYSYCGATHEEDFFFENDASIEEIEEEIWEWANGFIDISYEEVEREEEEEEKD